MCCSSESLIVGLMQFLVDLNLILLLGDSWLLECNSWVIQICLDCDSILIVLASACGRGNVHVIFAST